MVLTYLFDRFLQEAAFAQASGLGPDQLHHLQQRRILPVASYAYRSGLDLRSFYDAPETSETYRFYPKGLVLWAGTVCGLGLDSEARARSYFEQRFRLAAELFFSGTLGTDLDNHIPDIRTRFEKTELGETWEHFLSGTYGVCTRDSLPETIFLKQAGVDFMDALNKRQEAGGSSPDLDLIRRLLVLLESVESEFAPHERPFSSRRRCVDDVKSRYFPETASHPAA